MAIRIGNRSTIAIAVVAASLLGAPSRTRAAVLEVRATVDGSTLIDVLDNGPGDNNPAIGIIGIGTTTTPVLVGGLQVFGSLSTSNAPGASLSQIASQSLNV